MQGSGVAEGSAKGEPRLRAALGAIQGAIEAERESSNLVCPAAPGAVHCTAWERRLQALCRVWRPAGAMLASSMG